MNAIEQQFGGLLTLIERQRSAASQAVNEKQLATAWFVGGYISSKLKSEEWGNKVVGQFAEYVKVHAPDLKGFGRRNLYNFIMFYEEYSSLQFIETAKKYLPAEIVQPVVAQLTPPAIIQTPSGQLTRSSEIVQPETGQLTNPLIVQSLTAQLPDLERGCLIRQPLFFAPIGADGL